LIKSAADKTHVSDVVSLCYRCLSVVGPDAVALRHRSLEVGVGDVDFRIDYRGPHIRSADHLGLTLVVSENLAITGSTVVRFRITNGKSPSEIIRALAAIHSRSTMILAAICSTTSSLTKRACAWPRTKLSGVLISPNPALQAL
jgi:hypothetical protein